MARIDLACQECRHTFKAGACIPVAEPLRCPQCGSVDVHQTFSSYMRNGPLSGPKCGEPTLRVG